MNKRINLVCDKCSGPVWLDIESNKYIDMSCIYCGKRYFVKKAKWKKLEKKLEGKKDHAALRARGKLILEERRKNLQGR
jgi:DNA-directed RNA polymerase subunit RPC12/RpoP